MKPASVTIKNLFYGETTGGMDFDDWDRLTQTEQLHARLEFIAWRAGVLCSVPYSPEIGLPANVWMESRQLQQLARKALDAIEGEDFTNAAVVALEAGKLLEGIKKWMLAAKAVEVTQQIIDTEPDRLRGVKVLKGAKTSGGDQAKKRESERAEYQPYINNLYEKNRQQSYSDLQTSAAKYFGVSKKTIQRNTSNPIKS